MTSHEILEPAIKMMSSNEQIFLVTGPLCGEFTGHSVISPHKGQWRGALMFSVICAWRNGWVNNREAGDLRRHNAHYDVIVMCFGSGPHKGFSPVKLAAVTQSKAELLSVGPLGTSLSDLGSERQ